MRKTLLFCSLLIIFPAADSLFSDAEGIFKKGDSFDSDLLSGGGFLAALSPIINQPDKI